MKILASCYYKQLYVGLKVMTIDDGTYGVINEICTIHNIYIRYTNEKFKINGAWEGEGIYCLDKTCEDFDDFEIVDTDFLNKIREMKFKQILK